MSDNEINEAFANAYNNFDSRPLSGQTLRDFYVDDFTKDAVKSIKTTIKISERYRKMLVIGHRGCGKSTILNKVSEELNDNFHLVSFSAADTLNMKDVETIDILISIYLQLLNSLHKLQSINENKIKYAFDKFNEIMQSVKNKLRIVDNEVGVNLFKIISFKIKVEDESRLVLRKEFRNKIQTLNNGISSCILSILENYENQNDKVKEVLIVIDDLDKLELDFAKKIFFKDSQILTMPEAKIIYTFPLETYYCEEFLEIKDRYEDQFISLVVVDEDQNGDIGIQQLRKVILQRINEQYIEPEALKYMILLSGGLLRDLIKFMQDACKKAIVQNAEVITQNIAEDVINDAVNHYEQKFDFLTYKEEVITIKETHKRSSITNKNLIYLLRYLFVLEYKLKNGKLWYDVHPCLEKVLKGEQQ